MRFLLRADASDAIGYGHIMRCISLAERLTREGHRAEIFAHDLPKPISDLFSSSTKFFECAADYVPHESGSITVVDSYTIKDTRSDVMRMRDNWFFIRSDLLRAKRDRDTCKNILISTGGINQGIENVWTSPESNITLRTCSFADYPNALAWADLVVGAGGVSALERAYLGIPALVGAVATNQLPNIEFLFYAFAAIPIDLSNSDAKTEWLICLSKNPDLFVMMCNKAKKAVPRDSYPDFWKSVTDKYFQ